MNTTAMELDDLENINKNDFLPLLPLIKQELLDNTESTPATSAGNPCDSVEKQVDETTTAGENTSTKCVWCSQVLTSNDRPKLLECLHVACSQCVQTKFSELDRTMPPLIHCPTCNMASQNEFIIDNQFLIEQNNITDSIDNQSGSGGGGGGGIANSLLDFDNKLKSSISIKCSSCSDDANATSWCVDCSEYICDNCVQAHQRLKITKDHTIKPKEEATNDQSNCISTPKSLMCSTHTQEKLSLFCETCDKLTCRDCQLTDHRDHKYKFAHEIATETRNSLNSLLSEINYKRFLLTSARKVIDDRQNLIAEKKKELIKEITTMVVKITNTVNSRGKQLAMRLNEVCDTKLKVLNEKKEALQLLSENTDHCIDFVQAALDKGSDCAILYSKKTLARHLQKLKCQRADIPNPEIPVRIQVQLNQVPELQKVISQLGNIIVDGKPYPPPPSPNGPPRQQPSPNMAPPLRPSLPPPGMAQISPGGPSGYQNGPPMYNSTSPQQQFNNMQMNRPFVPEASGVRFTNMGPVGMQRQGQTHVSSSTHPQNMDISLRGLLNNQTGQPSQNQAHMGYSGGPPNYPGNTPSNGPPHQNMPPSMRPHYMGGPPPPPQPQQHQNFPQTQPGPPQPQNFLNNGPRFQNFQRLNNHPQNLSNQTQQAMRPMMQNNLGFPGPQGFSQNPPQPTAQQMGLNMHSVAKWHIPQSAQQANGSSATSQGPLMQFPNGRQGENFKINLKSPNTLKSLTPNGHQSGGGHGGNSGGGGSGNGVSGTGNILPNVTSTNPKTPSPSTNDASKDFTEPIDKVRDDSINDLMATIAKLDSNGVQVLPEGRNKTTSPQVHSSTDISTQELTEKQEKDDPNEDWCAVCLDGGELMCCDKCPKVFHQNCHIPAISSLPDESETWQCLLCVNLKELINNLHHDKRSGELSPNELKIIQRICLEIYCQYEQSLPFREPESHTNTAYYEIICNPMSLDVIRSRLDQNNPNHYKDISSFISDVRLIFKNVYLFYQEDSKIYGHARYLENFFEEQLIKWLPKYAMCNSNNKDDECNPPKRIRKLTE